MRVNLEAAYGNPELTDATDLLKAWLEANPTRNSFTLWEIWDGESFPLVDRLNRATLRLVADGALTVEVIGNDVIYRIIHKNSG